MDFKKKSRSFFIIIFKLKSGNFKTRDFSPLVEKVLASVKSDLKNEWNQIYKRKSACTLLQLIRGVKLYLHERSTSGAASK